MLTRSVRSGTVSKPAQDALKESAVKIFSHSPIGPRASWRYLLQPSMLHGLLIGDVKGAELDLIPDACDDAPTCVDYTNLPVLFAQGKKRLAR